MSAGAGDKTKKKRKQKEKKERQETWSVKKGEAKPKNPQPNTAKC